MFGFFCFSNAARVIGINTFVDSKSSSLFFVVFLRNYNLLIASRSIVFHCELRYKSAAKNLPMLVHFSNLLHQKMDF
jgi:hypothetical protein